MIRIILVLWFYWVLCVLKFDFLEVLVVNNKSLIVIVIRWFYEFKKNIMFLL